MNINTQKEEFSYAYIYAVASAVGYSFQRATTPLDQVGVDVTITAVPETPQSKRLTLLDLQVKCTSRDVLTDDEIRYPLPIKNYEELRYEEHSVPRILVLVVVPDNSDEWLYQSQAKLCLKHCGYWISLRGQPATQNQETVTVYLPRKNMFTVDALKSMMQRIKTGGIL
ncbi:MAG TPA: hypothetical protein DCE56_25340 [Cyanobacteria bacterium UBA8553]|nr:hypothetical protein [Cyanobacteria bacterium UBA8553]HAJ63848.1 hypothetical protein [Cyanobacteria bacterium UBA8543]